ncbi:sterol desaturase family protein [Pseudomonas sp. MBLB4136]|uniref:sterol desaturase family protein n=1 Tax=Pseudomonas sp. MBLB4136 TaxID=3451558 RepID=UPI003F755807
MQQLLSRTFLLISVCASLAAFFFAYHAGLDLEVTVLAATVATLVAGMLFERFAPYREDWRRNRGDAGTDVISAMVLVGMVEPLLKAAGPVALVSLLGAASIAPSEAFLASLPLALQILAATLLIELGRYWSHRLHHMAKPLWWLHAMHHSSERLYSLNNFRFHPLNHATNFIVGMLPAMLLGFSPEALLGYLALTQPVLMLQHANIDLKSGWLNFIFSSNELHRWHHSSDAREGHVNFGSALVIWDQVFKTFYLGGNNRAPVQVGLFADSAAYPGRSGYFSQLRSLFSPGCCVG